MSKNKLTIDLKTAQTFAKKWRDPSQTFDYRNLHGFLIQKETLQNLLDQSIDAARAYIGLNENGEATLMIVGTRFSEQTETYDDMLPEKSQLKGEIYDFTVPCPRFCGHKSALNDLTL